MPSTELRAPAIRVTLSPTGAHNGRIPSTIKGRERTLEHFLKRVPSRRIVPSPAALSALGTLYSEYRKNSPRESRFESCARLLRNFQPLVGVTWHPEVGKSAYARLLQNEPDLAHHLERGEREDETYWLTPEEGWRLQSVLALRYDEDLFTLGGGGVRFTLPGWETAWPRMAIQQLLHNAENERQWAERFQWLAGCSPLQALDSLESRWWPASVTPGIQILRPFLVSNDAAIRRRAGRLAGSFRRPLSSAEDESVHGTAQRR